MPARKKYLTSKLDVKDVSDAGEFSGHGSVFSNVDAHGDVVAKGAFENSLKDHKKKNSMPALLWQHMPHEPIGVFKSMQEDARGLFVEGQLATSTNRGSEAHELLKMGALSGLSIGFVTKQFERDIDSGIDTLTEIDLWEVSLVTFPANELARVDAVKAALADGEVPSKQELELILRDVGLSRRHAKALISIGYEGLIQRDAENDLLGRIHELTQRVQNAN